MFENFASPLWLYCAFSLFIALSIRDSRREESGIEYGILSTHGKKAAPTVSLQSPRVVDFDVRGLRLPKVGDS
ncbi:hypothetical protein ZHAS_00022056 [Anopheles sinensis]|uniref:Uncharacterized protein n=1 Tax=Anopheles sinensis TaxID=74873 RepID=A0A084WUC3_ANOSI|nr:hypothetical protein ZHAS_00022056 [Anopheles sinensis]